MDGSIVATPPAFKLTINLPAERQFFDGEGVVGMRIKIEEGQAYFRPVTTKRGSDSVTFYSRPRGGFEVEVEGRLSGELLEVLMAKASVACPFFVMQKVGKSGWIGLRHHPDGEPPAKFIPHMRVWPPGRRAVTAIIPPLCDEITDLLGPFVSVIRAAKQVVDDHERERKIGRPSRDLIEARQVLQSATLLFSEISPAPPVPVDTTPVQAALDLLNSYMHDTRRGALIAPTAPIHLRSAPPLTLAAPVAAPASHSGSEADEDQAAVSEALPEAGTPEAVVEAAVTDTADQEAPAGESEDQPNLGIAATDLPEPVAPAAPAAAPAVTVAPPSVTITRIPEGKRGRVRQKLAPAMPALPLEQAIQDITSKRPEPSLPAPPSEPLPLETRSPAPALHVVPPATDLTIEPDPDFIEFDTEAPISRDQARRPSKFWKTGSKAYATAR